MGIYMYNYIKVEDFSNLVFFELFLDHLDLRMYWFLRGHCLFSLSQSGLQRSVTLVKLCCFLPGLLQLDLLGLGYISYRVLLAKTTVVRLCGIYICI